VSEPQLTAHAQDRFWHRPADFGRAEIQSAIGGSWEAKKTGESARSKVDGHAGSKVDRSLWIDAFVSGAHPPPPFPGAPHLYLADLQIVEIAA
jgi:hypothetical protein